MTLEIENFDYRIKLGKLWESRFISHLDLMRSLARAMRRTGLPVYFSRGFNPRPKVSYLTPPLSVGVTSECEIFDMRLDDQHPAEELAALLRANLPKGLALIDAVEAPKGSLRISWVEYLVFVTEAEDSTGGLRETAAAAFAELPEEYFAQPVASADEKFIREAIRIPGLADTFCSFYTTAFSVRFKSGEGAGSPLKALAELFGARGLAHHYHRVSAG